MLEVARNAAAASVFRIMASEDKGEKVVENFRNLPDAALDIMGKMNGIPEHQLSIHRSMIRGEDNEFIQGLDQVDGLLQPGDVVLMTGNQVLAKAQKAFYQNAKSSHVEPVIFSV